MLNARDMVLPGSLIGGTESGRLMFYGMPGNTDFVEVAIKRIEATGRR